MTSVLLRIFLAIVVCFVFGGFVSAQPKLDFKAGVNFSNALANSYGLNGSDKDLHFENLVRGYTGVSVEFKISSMFTFLPELAYVGMGYRYPGEPRDFNDYNPARYHYLTLPVGIKYDANEYFGVFMGVYASYMIGGSSVIDPLSGDYTKIPVSHIRERFDFGLHVGAESLIYKNFGLGIRYFYGLKDIEKPLGDDYKLFNRSLQCYVFYQLSFKK